MAKASDARHTQVGFAALNNAQWCAAMCRAHGGRSHLSASLWHADQPMPAFYPSAVTLRSTAQAQAEILRKIATARLAAGSTVKDSYATLDLAAAGFAPLFDAAWLWRPLDAPAGDTGGLQWRRVADEATLARWQTAWSAEALTPPVFVPALLQQGEHFILAGWRGSQIVAGCVASHSKAVIGLSNWFAPSLDAAEEVAALQACAAAIAQWHPELPLAGYETGERLARFQAAGFAPIGPLRVWRKS
jgi:hypothetical protein